MPVWIPILAAVLGAALILVTIVFLRMVMELTRSIKTLTSKIEGLEKRIAKQEAQVADIRKALAQERNDPIVEIVNSIVGWRQKGMLPTLAALGAQLFRSYWRSKGPKPLPARKEH